MRENVVYTGSKLVSLPGYKSEVRLESGVHLLLWGNLPEFSQMPPVLESAVTLHLPDPKIDAEFTKNRTDDQRIEDEKTLVVLSNRLAKTHCLPVWTICSAQQVSPARRAGSPRRCCRPP